MIEYTLIEPVTLGTQTIDKVVFEKPKGKHLRKMPIECKCVDDFMPMLCALSNQSVAFFDALSMQDFQKIMEQIGDFFPS